MAKKSANIMVRVEPEVKAKAEAVMNELGVPASVVVNMLYKHIIRTGGIPFPVSLGNGGETIIPPESTAEEIDLEALGLKAPKGAKNIITIV